MKWVLKASLQKPLSYFPRRDDVNYFMQRKLTRGLPVSDEKFYEKVFIANRHFNSFLEYCQLKDLSTAAFYEFGAGWDLISPFTYYSLGIEHQTIVDIRPHLRFELINDTLRRFVAFKSRLEKIIQKPIRDFEATPINSILELKSRFGIDYLAPRDARDTKFAAESYDFISNTSTLEHIPETEILEILLECFRLLKPGGIVSSVIDMKDHYSYFDANISCYNFLKFSDILWSLVDSPLQFQNRLRYPDYIKLLERSGFEILAQEINKPTTTELKALQKINLSSRFKGKYSLEDLGIKVVKVVTRKERKYINEQ